MYGPGANGGEEEEAVFVDGHAAGVAGEDAEGGEVGGEGGGGPGEAQQAHRRGERRPPSLSKHYHAPALGKGHAQPEGTLHQDSIWTLSLKGRGGTWRRRWVSRRS